MEEISKREWNEKLSLCSLPDIFPSFLLFIKTEDAMKEPMLTRIQKKVSQKPNGNIVEEQKALIGNKEVKSHTSLKIIGNVNSPLARRRFGAQTLSNTESQHVAASNKLSHLLPSDTRAAHNVFRLKPVTRKLISLVPQLNEIVNLNPHSPTSVLSAHSKVPCGIKEKSNDYNPHIDEIDLPDISNPQAVPEYVQDLYAFYKQQEHLHRPIDYMDKQPHVDPEMREILVDWLIEVHYIYKLLPETLYLTIYIVDRYLSLDGVTRRNLPLVGTCAMLIACKYEEIRSPKKDYFVDIVFKLVRYTREEILRMEKMILNKLGWYLTIPTNYMFLVRYVKVAKADQKLEHMIYFFAELGLMQYDLLKYCPSMVAASAVYAARCTLGKSPFWTDALERHTSFSKSQLLECAQVLVKAHCSAPGRQSKVVYQKYTLQQFGGAACYPPAMSLIGVSKLV